MGIHEPEVVTSGNVVTAQGPGNAIKFALRLVEELFDHHKAHDVGAQIIYKY